MRLIRASLVVSTLLAGFSVTCAQQGDTTTGAAQDFNAETPPRGAYLGQEPPGSEPVVFAPGIISTAAFELNSAFTPDGRELYQTLVVDGWGFSAIIRRYEGEDGWVDPVVAPFSGRYNDIDPNLSPDGNSIFFISRRPSNADNKELSEAWDIWLAKRGDSRDAWEEARRLPEPVNSLAAELYPSVTMSGTIYFGSNREGGFGGFDIYRAEMTDSGYTEVENLGAAINSEHAETDAFVSPDESYLVVTVTGRADSRGRNDLYISFRQDDATWGELHHMGDAVNTAAKEYCPVASPDGRFFFFTRGRDDSIKLHSERLKTYQELAEMTYSWRNNLENVYWVDAGVLREETYD